MLAGAKQRGGHRETLGALQRFDRRTRGNPSVERDFHRVVRGRGGHRPDRGDCRRLAAFRQLRHFERSRSVGQAADETPLLEGGDETVNAGLGLELERLAHLVEARADAALLQSIVDEEQQFTLLRG